MNPIAKIENVASTIHWIRGEKVILDRDLAPLYEIETRALKQAVRRNAERFPDDFMFQLTDEEVEMLVSQNVIPGKSALGGAQPARSCSTALTSSGVVSGSWSSR